MHQDPSSPQGVVHISVSKEREIATIYSDCILDPRVSLAAKGLFALLNVARGNGRRVALSTHENVQEIEELVHELRVYRYVHLCSTEETE